MAADANALILLLLLPLLGPQPTWRGLLLASSRSKMTRCCHSAIDFAVMHSSVLAQRCGTIGREGPSWMLSAGARLTACPATDEICGWLRRADECLHLLLESDQLGRIATPRPDRPVGWWDGAETRAERRRCRTADKAPRRSGARILLEGSWRCPNLTGQPRRFCGQPLDDGATYPRQWTAEWSWSPCCAAQRVLRGPGISSTLAPDPPYRIRLCRNAAVQCRQWQ